MNSFKPGGRKLNTMTRNIDDLDDMWEDREKIAETEYAVSIFEHLDEKDEENEDKETEQE